MKELLKQDALLLEKTIAPGRYRFLEKLGEGGSSDVYLCEQLEPVRRRVALKTLRPGMQSREMLARFNAERQVLARLSHAHIVQLLDPGTDTSSLPYFAMEHIAGKNLLAWCDDHKLPLRQRLRLMLQVCSAVNYAHQRGVIHRDLKPANILVTDVAGKAHARLIDFGIARSISLLASSAGKELARPQFSGTPVYMSPEQLAQGPMVADTRSDIYSLGMMLYELLCGALPFEEDPAKMSLSQLRDRVNHPKRPSQRALAVGDERAQQRGFHRATQLARALRDELDWILLKALEKNPAQRYASVDAFEADIQRVLDREPVLARRPSRRYAVKKFVQRHAFATVLGSLIAATLVGFSVHSLLNATQLRNERDIANAETQRATAVTDFMVELFETAHPHTDGADVLSLRQLVDIAARRLELGDALPLHERAQMAFALGRLYFELGDYDDSLRLLQQALSQLEGADRARARMHLGVLQSISNDDAAGAANLLEAFGELNSLLGPGHTDTLLAENYKYRALQDLGEYESSELGYRDLLTRLPETRPELSVTRVLSLYGLSLAQFAQGKLEEARQTLEEAYPLSVAAIGERHKYTSWVQSKIAEVALTQGDYARAETMFRAELEYAREIYGDDHPNVASGYNAIASVLFYQQRYEEAEAAFKAAIAIRSQEGKDSHNGLFSSMSNLAMLYSRMERNEEARSLFEELLPKANESFGESSVQRGTLLLNYAGLLAKLGELNTALRHYEESLRLFVGVHGEQYYQAGNTRRLLGETLIKLGRRDEGLREMQSGVAILTATLGEEHPRTVKAKEALERVLAK